MLALTATAPPMVIKRLCQCLCMNRDVKVITKNPNRENVFLQRKIRLPNQYGTLSFEKILVPIANELKVRRQGYPVTIIYMKLKYCGFEYKLFDKVLGDDQFVESSTDPCTRLFAQYHAPQTQKMKSGILNEIKQEHSMIRVILVTTALGMGVNVANVSQIIHIGPPSSLEQYMQEIGRAGRNGCQASAILYFNNSDISKNNKIIDKSIRDYCSSEGCLRRKLLQYFGFIPNIQERCCGVCNNSDLDVTKNHDQMKKPVRNTPGNSEEFYHEFKSIIEFHTGNSNSDIFNYPKLDSGLLAKKILDEITFISSESDLLEYNIWDENCASALYELISQHAPYIDQPH